MSHYITKCGKRSEDGACTIRGVLRYCYAQGNRPQLIKTVFVRLCAEPNTDYFLPLSSIIISLGKERYKRARYWISMSKDKDIMIRMT